MPKLPGETQGHFEMRVFGHKLGCDVQKSIDETNRRLGIGEITEFVPTVSLKQLRAAASVDLSKYDSPVSDQDGIGDYCAGRVLIVLNGYKKIYRVVFSLAPEWLSIIGV